jgi:hypothetical protein
MISPAAIHKGVKPDQAPSDRYDKPRKVYAGAQYLGEYNSLAEIIATLELAIAEPKGYA